MREDLEERAVALAAASSPGYDAAVALSIDLGMFEAAIADALSPEVDHAHALTQALRTAAVQAAHGCLAALAGDVTRQRACAAQLCARLASLHLAHAPESLPLHVPEGFAYYGLYPEMYAEAARVEALASRPRHAVCVGIRSIGTTLSAFAAAGLEQAGCTVTTWTLRPHGDPFERRVRIGADVATKLTSPMPDAAFIADEGPGLSGSSFAAVVEALIDLGIPADRIVLLPSWVPDGQAFYSARARQTWRRHRKLHVPFEQRWIDGGRLARSFAAATLTEISAGKWRAVWLPDKTPAVQPQHERRKFLANGSGAPRVIKFAGLGRFGEHAVARAQALEGATVEQPARLVSGFMERVAISGTPLAPGTADESFIAHAARYLSTVHDRCATDTLADRETLAALIETNARELLPDGPLPGLKAIVKHGRALPPARAIRLDARMLPHEWLRTTGGYVKVDALEHHDDHFFPGPQDIAWDVAATIVEFALSRQQRERFVAQLVTLLRDASLDGRLPFYTAAYLAFRAGYCAVGSQALAEGPDQQGLRAAADGYVAQLRALVG